VKQISPTCCWLGAPAEAACRAVSANPPGSAARPRRPAAASAPASGLGPQPPQRPGKRKLRLPGYHPSASHNPSTRPPAPGRTSPAANSTRARPLPPCLSTCGFPWLGFPRPGPSAADGRKHQKRPPGPRRRRALITGTQLLRILVGTLCLSCGRSCMVNASAARDSEASRDPGPAEFISLRHQAASRPSHQGDHHAPESSPTR